MIPRTGAPAVHRGTPCLPAGQAVSGCAGALLAAVRAATTCATASPVKPRRVAGTGAPLHAALPGPKRSTTARTREARA